MEDLEFIIKTILKKQSEDIAGQLGNIGWLMKEFECPRLPEVSVGYGFVYENERLKLSVSLEYLGEDIE